MESKPHIRPLSIGEILDLAFRIYRARFLTLAGITALPLIPVLILEIILLLSTSSVMAEFSNLIIQIAQLLSQGFVLVALAIAISHIYLQKPLTLGVAYRQGWARFGTYILAAILMGLAIGIPTVVLGACGIFGSIGFILVFIIAIPIIVFVRTRWAVVIPTIMLEDAGATDALGRSFNLTEGYFWRVFGTSTLASLLVWTISLLPQIAILFFFDAILSSEVTTILTITIAQIVLILTMPLSMAVTTLIYYDLRIRKEGFDLEVIAETPQELLDDILPDDV